MRDRTIAQHGQASALGEQVWIGHYVEVRRDWLANHPNMLLRKTVYRMDSFRKLIAQGNWALTLPFVVRGVQIEEEILGGPPLRVSAQEEEERLLLLRSIYARRGCESPATSTSKPWLAQQRGWGIWHSYRGGG